MRAAAADLRASTDLNSARALSREIAERVIAAMLNEAQADPAAALPGIAARDPIGTLAASPSIGTVDEFGDRFRDKMRAFGTFIPPIFQQEAQRRAAALEMRAMLTERYAKHLRENYFRERA